MRRLKPQKLLTVIASSALENTLAALARRHGVTGYTIVQASGAGASGVQSGRLDIDTNILMYVILGQPGLPALLDELEAMARRGHHLKVFVSDIAALDS